MADIPSELFTEILSLLPVQSLLRFRSLSKSLRTLIDSHNFINLHLKNSLNFNLILRYDYKIYQVDFPNLTTCVQLDSPLMLYNPNVKPPHYDSHPNNHVLIGSCNGLLCIYTNDGFITIWNPNTRKYWVISDPPNPNRYYGTMNPNLGFGFDPFTGDYKVVRLSTSFLFKDTELRLFSSVTNSWRLLGILPYVIYPERMGVFFLHSLHWVVKSNFNDSPHLIVIAINLTLENLNEVPLPDIGGGIANRERFSIAVAVLGGCLSILVNYSETDEIDVWVMKDYGSRDSWFKLFTLMKSCFSQPWYGSSIRSLSDLRPLGYSSDRKKVLFKVYQRQLCWYDLKSEQVNYVTGIPNCYEAMICVGSLVQPPYLRTNQHMFKKRERRRTRNSGCSSCLWFWK